MWEGGGAELGVLKTLIEVINFTPRQMLHAPIGFNVTYTHGCVTYEKRIFLMFFRVPATARGFYFNSRIENKIRTTVPMSEIYIVQEVSELYF